MTDKEFKEKLSQIRGRIDEIDDEIIRLLDIRTGMVNKVRSLKEKHGIKGSFIRSGREARMIYDLLDKPALFPKEAIYPIWRLIISASVNIEQKEIKVIYNDEKLIPQIVEYFGNFIKREKVENFSEVLAKMDDSKYIGIMPNEGEWWLNLPEGVHIFAELPLLTDEPQAYAIALIEPEYSGCDDYLLIADKGIDGDYRIIDEIGSKMLIRSKNMIEGCKFIGLLAVM